MAADKLASALESVDWNANVDKFVHDTTSAEAIESANLRLATWARQFESADSGNPALCFVREMQAAGHHVAALAALALYRAAAASMRSMLEAALYYTYFRTHPSELATLVRDSGFFLEKRDIVDYHKSHTPEFSAVQQKLGLLTRLEKWYGFVSSIIHGQSPGAWINHRSFADIKYSKSTLDVVVQTFRDGEDVVHRFFLCTVGRELWDSFSSSSKRKLISGLAGDVKATLRIDSA